MAGGASASASAQAQATGAAAAPARLAAVVAALVLGQVGLHGALNGLKLAVPLQALQWQLGPAAIGGLLALFAVLPVLLAWPAGRWVDRQGHRRPTQLAALLVLGGTLAGTASGLAGGHTALLGLAALLAGAGAAIGMIAVQRTAGALARTPAQRLQVFSWVALAPSAATLAGPLLAGALMDRAGFTAACAGLAALPLLTLLACLAVPRDAARAAVAASGVAVTERSAAPRRPPAWGLLGDAGLRRLFFINWLIAACWDAHALALPLLGHQRGLSAQSLASVLACYAVASAAVRLLIPLLARRLQAGRLMALGLALAAAVFATYPWLHSAWAMAAAAALLGLGLGAIQPAVMATLHVLSPPGRQGEALGLRSTVIHFSTLVMPLGLGALGAAMGVLPVLWLTAAALAAGAWQAKRLPTDRGEAKSV